MLKGLKQTTDAAGHRDPQRLIQNCVLVSPVGTGQQWTVAGALAAVDLRIA